MSELTKKGFEFFEHTADVGMRARGETLEALFVHAAQGLVELLVENSPLVPRQTREIALSAETTDALLKTWLKELLFLFHTDRAVPVEYEFDALSETALEGRVVADRFDPARHLQGVEVKGVTYHDLRVARGPAGWEASVIFDV